MWECEYSCLEKREESSRHIWNWSHRRLATVLCGWWRMNLGPLQEQSSCSSLSCLSSHCIASSKRLVVQTPVTRNKIPLHTNFRYFQDFKPRNFFLKETTGQEASEFCSYFITWILLYLIFKKHLNQERFIEAKYILFMVLEYTNCYSQCQYHVCLLLECNWKKNPGS